MNMTTRHQNMSVDAGKTLTGERVDTPKTADAWDLYSHVPGADSAAQELSAKLEVFLIAAHNAGNCTMDEARRIRDRMYVEMEKYRDLGACDTEPEVVLVTCIETSLGLTERLSR